MSELLEIQPGDQVKHPKFGTRFVISLRGPFAVTRNQDGDEVELNRVVGETKLQAVNDVPVDEVKRYVPTQYKPTLEGVEVPDIALPVLKEKQPEPKGKAKWVEKFEGIKPVVVSGALIAYIRSAAYTLRIHWSTLIDADVRAHVFNRLKLDVNDILPIETGKRGGTTKQYSLAGVFTCPEPPAEFAPEFEAFGYKTDGRGRGRINDVRFVLALMLAGIEANAAKKRA